MTANPRLPATNNFRRKSLATTQLPTPASITNLSELNNANALRLPKFRAALARVNSGQGNALVLGVGDSQTEGIYSTAPYSTGYATANYKNCFLAHLANAFNRQGIPAHFNSTYGNGQGLKYTGDTRVANSGFTAPSANTIGGRYYFANSSATLSFTPTKNVDKFVIYYGVSTGLGSFSYKIDGGSPTTVNTNNTAAFGSTTITCPTLGIHTVTITWVSGSVYFSGFKAYDSTRSWVEFGNAGWIGVTTDGSSNNSGYSDATTPSAPLSAAVALAPDLVILELGQNDPINSLNITDTVKNLQTMITAFKAVSDVVLVDQIPLPLTGQNGGGAGTFLVSDVQLKLSNELKALAVRNNIPLVNVQDRWVSYAFSSALSPNFYGNTTTTGPLHPSGPGHADYAQAIYEVIRSGVGAADPALTLTADAPLNTLVGTTAGSVVYSQPIVGTAHKKFVAQAVGYENNTAVNQTITYPTAFTYTPVVTTNSTSLTVSTTTTTLTITAPNNTTLFSGTLIVEGI